MKIARTSRTGRESKDRDIGKIITNVSSCRNKTIRLLTTEGEILYLSYEDADRIAAAVATWRAYDETKGE